MDQKFLRADGTIEVRPSLADLKRAQRDQIELITYGELCTACLVGSWGITMRTTATTLCAECRWLDVHVTARAGATSPARAGRAPEGAVLSLGGAAGSDGHDAWAPIRAARGWRAQRLARVFTHAEELGGRVTQPHGVPAVDYSDVRDLIPSSPADRVRRYAEWLRALSPAEHAERAEVLADIGGLATELRHHIQAAEQRKAQAHMKAALREARDAVGRAVRAPGAIGRALVGVVRSRAGAVPQPQ